MFKLFRHISSWTCENPENRAAYRKTGRRRRTSRCVYSSAMNSKSNETAAKNRFSTATSRDNDVVSQSARRRQTPCMRVSCVRYTRAKR